MPSSFFTYSVFSANALTTLSVVSWAGTAVAKTLTQAAKASFRMGRNMVSSLFGIGRLAAAFARVGVAGGFVHISWRNGQPLREQAHRTQRAPAVSRRPHRQPPAAPRIAKGFPPAPFRRAGR